MHPKIARRDEMLRDGEETVACPRNGKFQLAVLFTNANSSQRTQCKAPVGRVIVSVKRLLAKDFAVKEESAVIAHICSKTSREFVRIESSESVAQNGTQDRTAKALSEADGRIQMTIVEDIKLAAKACPRDSVYLSGSEFEQRLAEVGGHVVQSFAAAGELLQQHTILAALATP